MISAEYGLKILTVSNNVALHCKKRDVWLQL